MQRISGIAMGVGVWVLALGLAGCGDSTPLPAVSGSGGQRNAEGTYTPSSGAFAAIPSLSSKGVTPVANCNLDAVDDKPAGSEPLQRDSVAMFAGWAAGPQPDTVPAKLQLVLKGAQDYAVNAATGMPRPDVAKASGHPAWASAGYAVKADLAAVVPGTYTPVLVFSLAGKDMQCATQHKLTVQ